MTSPLVWVRCWSFLLSLCYCQFLLLCLSVSVLRIEVLLCSVYRHLQLLRLPLGLIPWWLCISSLSLVIFFKVCFFWYEDCWSSICFPFAWNVFSHPLTFSLYVSLGLKWISWRQHICGSCFCTHSVSLCLMVGAFNSFTFKVIIDIYVPIAILLIVWGWFCRYFSSLVFLDYISSFNICCKASLVVLNSLNFYFLEKLFISPSILNEILASFSNLGFRFFFPFSTLNISCHSLLACRVSAERSAVKCLSFPLYVTCCFSLAALIFFLCV